MKVIKAPGKVDFTKGNMTLFLGGSIEMGKAEKWQDRIIADLKEFDDLLVLNPRRDDWDSSWVQSKNNPQFREQVEWELDCQENCDIIIYYFAKGTISPITLLELGLFGDLHGTQQRIIYVYCPEGHERKGNVDIVCEKCGIIVFETYEELLDELKTVIITIEGCEEAY